MFLQTLCLSLAAGVNGNRCSESFTLLEKYRIGKVIGDGNFAVVKECMDRWVALDLFPYAPLHHFLKESALGTSSSGMATSLLSENSYVHKVVCMHVV